MKSLKNQCIILVARPEGLPEDDCWRLEERPLPQLTAGQVLVEAQYISIDPAMRAWLDEACYLSCVELGQPMWAFAVGTVVESLHDDFCIGDKVRGLCGVQRYSAMAGEDLDKIDHRDEPLSYHLGIYGYTGLTAYFGMTDLVTVNPGDQVLISTAAGSVGSVAAQLAKMRGARVAGIAGGQKKGQFCVEELGMDACVDYKAADFEQRLARAMPDGVDVYFDNVGVPILDAALRLMNECGKVIICGAINQYQNMGQVKGPSEYLKIPERKLSMLGFTCFHYAERYPEGVAALRQLLDTGQLKYFEERAQGLDQFPAHLNKLFSGDHRGKLVISL